MTLCIFKVSPERIFIATDTIAGDAFRQQPITKLFALPHSNTVICGRGSAALLLQAGMGASIMNGDVESVASQLAAAIPTACVNLLAAGRAQGLQEIQLAELLGGQEINVFGWSDTYNEMLAVQLVRPDGGAQFATDIDVVDSATPWPTEVLGERPELNCAEAFMETARRQVEYCRTAYAGRPIGGQLILAELTRHQIRVTNLGDIK
jgi:hypothetical protein